MAHILDQGGHNEKASSSFFVATVVFINFFDGWATVTVSTQPIH